MPQEPALHALHPLLEAAGRARTRSERYVWPERAAAAGSMSGGPQLQLAVLWPWLLMATLQVGLGHTGLALAAAVESERSAAQKAIIRVIPLKVEPIILEGEFANVAEVTPAEGKLLQVRAALFYPALPTSRSHSLYLCPLFSPCCSNFQHEAFGCISRLHVYNLSNKVFFM